MLVLSPFIDPSAQWSRITEVREKGDRLKGFASRSPLWVHDPSGKPSSTRAPGDNAVTQQTTQAGPVQLPWILVLVLCEHPMDVLPVHLIGV